LEESFFWSELKMECVACKQSVTLYQVVDGIDINVCLKCSPELKATVMKKKREKKVDPKQKTLKTFFKSKTTCPLCKESGRHDCIVLKALLYDALGIAPEKWNVPMTLKPESILYKALTH
jgi:hypothetical protein